MPTVPVLPEVYATTNSSPVRVLIVDDSAVMRKLLVDVLAGDPGIEVVGKASGGEIAIQQLEKLKPDVITLDVEMPGMDGIETLKHIKERNTGARVVMLSTLTERGNPVTLKALMYGASDYCLKPTSSRSLNESMEYLRRELIPKVRQFARRAAIRLPIRVQDSPSLVAAPSVVPMAPLAPAGPALAVKTAHALVIGISTGGPQALALILPTIPKDYPLPILIVQHMPAAFTKLLAQRLNHECQIQVAEAVSGQIVKPGLALIAPGGFHMRVKRSGNNIITTLDQEAPENSCRPAVDVLFRSAAEVWGGNVIAAVLTGMGQDGLRGAQLLKQKGAWIVAQDEASSIVWGMPGAVVNAGVANEVVDLQQVIPAILKRTGRRAS